MLHRPSTIAFHHQSPLGSRCRKASSTSPTGRARTVAANRGRSGGRNCSVTRYVEPHAIGATAVTNGVVQRLVSTEDNLVSLEGNINPMPPEELDAVDRIVAQWARERPELDTGPMSIVGRVHRLAELLDAGLRPVFAEADLGNGDFDVLATLRRAGPPFRLTAGELSASTLVTSGAVSKRVDRLEARGLVTRTV